MGSFQRRKQPTNGWTWRRKLRIDIYAQRLVNEKKPHASTLSLSSKHRSGHAANRRVHQRPLCVRQDAGQTDSKDRNGNSSGDQTRLHQTRCNEGSCSNATRPTSKTVGTASARILQLEALHINNMQIDALKGVTKAFKGSKYTIGDVDELLDKLEDFKEDFDTINERLSEDIAFSNQDIDEDELMMELQQLEEKDTPSIQKMLTNQSPALPDAPKQVTLENQQGDHDACSTEQT